MYEKYLRLAKEVLATIPENITQQQQLYLETFIKCGEWKSTARELGRNESTVRKAIKSTFRRLGKVKSRVPEHHDDPVTDGFEVQGYSALYDQEGNRKLHWVKTRKDQADIYNDLKESLEELASDLPQRKAQKDPKGVDPQLMTVYPLGDPHIGLLTYTPEVGADWDLKIAEEKFLPLFDKLVTTAPASKECLIIDLGDFWHYDGMEQRTMRSGHKVDADGRPSKMVKVGFRIMLQMIASALKVHETVHVKVLPGNHDDLGSIFLRVALHHIFENDPRVKVDQSPNVFQYYTWGKNLLGIHHGDKCKLANLPMVMASDMPEDWGKTEFRKWLIGHFHHDSETIHRGKDLQGCSVETFRTIVAGEGYAHEAGYRAQQDGKAIVLHKDYGEVARYTVNISQIR